MSNKPKSLTIDEYVMFLENLVKQQAQEIKEYRASEEEILRLYAEKRVK